jgi:ferredoxin-fold anticodon binding domain-containing protein
MNYQHIENLLIRFRGQSVTIKTVSGGVYEGSITDVTNDYVALKVKTSGAEDDQIIILLHSMESVLPRRSD